MTSTSLDNILTIVYSVMISRTYALLYSYKLNIKFTDDLVIDKIGLAKMILLRLIVCHLMRLKRYHSEPLKNDCTYKQNWSKVEVLL